jgi:hypothetical protein
VTAKFDAKYMVLALATKQWIWLMNAHKDLNVRVTNAAMFCDNQATINIAYNNHKIGDQSKHIDVAYYLVRQNVQSGWISLLQLELAKNLADICTKGLSHVTL